ncbi:MAG: acyltransferase family protein [Oscillospiraceae bacterium]|jgi:peptidoglycan/LPS O-acetylase OafA/YrhL|nr:acyltransferase family protein [Oscillospiraceae bacterium]
MTETVAVVEPRPAKKQRVHSVEFWRFAFTAFVAIYHLEISLRGFALKLLPSGSTAVEFFFILAGFTMAMSAKRRSDALGDTPMASREAHKLAIDFVKGKLKAIYPILIVVLVIHIFFLNPGLTTLWSKIRAFMNDEWHLTFMVGTPFGYNNGMAVRGGIAALTPLWFLTELILVGYIYTYLINKNYNFMAWAAPAIALLGYIMFTLFIVYEQHFDPLGFSSAYNPRPQAGYSILDFAAPMGFLNSGTVHALAEMAMGISIFQLYDYLSKKKWRLPGKILLQAIELFALYRFFSLLFFAPLGLENFKRVLYIMVIVVLAFLNKTWLSRALNNIVSKGLGKISLTMYLIHWPLAMVYMSFVSALKAWAVKGMGNFDSFAIGLWNTLQDACKYDAAARSFTMTATDVVLYLLLVLAASVAITAFIAIVRKIAVALYGKYRSSCVVASN